MRVNSYMSSYMNLLLRSNISLHLNGYNKLCNDRLNINPYKDTSSFIKNDIDFDRAKEFLANKGLLSNLKSINGKEIKPLEAVNNVLTFKKGVYNKIKTKSGITDILTAGEGGVVYMPCDDIRDNFHLAPSDWDEVFRTEKLFTYLVGDKTGYLVRSLFSKDEVKETLGRAGIKPGWFEIKSGNYSNKFYMLDSGRIVGEYDVEATRNGVNNIDWFKEGYTRDSKFILDGKEYKLDEEGHLYIPKGEACIMQKLIRIK